MAKKNQVRRYGYEWGGQRKQWWQKTTTTILVIALAAGIGWFAYEPAYNFIMNMGGNLHTAATPPPSSAAAEPTPPTPPTAPTESAPAPAPSSSTSLPVATPPPEQVRSGLPQKTYYLSAQTLQSKEQLAIALDGIKAKGGNGVMFDLKNDRGEVLYDSALPIVAKNLALAEQPYSLAETLEAIRAAGLAPVGRIFAFKDSTSTASLTEGAVKYMNSKVNWLDNAKASGGKSWLNPNSAVARDYILELVDEAATAGVSCLVLDGVQFPDGLSLHLATYGGIPDKSAVLADFVRSAQQRAEKSGVKVYPVVMLSAAAGINDLPYGESPAKVMSAAGQAILDVRPEQFGL
ncbi:MAG: putative glycoside hydrolase, partial [Angelakisella sp.]